MSISFGFRLLDFETQYGCFLYEITSISNKVLRASFNVTVHVHVSWAGCNFVPEQHTGTICKHVTRLALLIIMIRLHCLQVCGHGMRAVCVHESRVDQASGELTGIHVVPSQPHALKTTSFALTNLSTPCNCGCSNSTDLIAGQIEEAQRRILLQATGECSRALVCYPVAAQGKE